MRVNFFGKIVLELESEAISWMCIASITICLLVVAF